MRSSGWGYERLRMLHDQIGISCVHVVDRRLLAGEGLPGAVLGLALLPPPEPDAEGAPDEGQRYRNGDQRGEPSPEAPQHSLHLRPKHVTAAVDERVYERLRLVFVGAA